jgi:hypothetical protein
MVQKRDRLLDYVANKKDFAIHGKVFFSYKWKIFNGFNGSETAYCGENY